MKRIEELKQELLSQKKAIEEKYGSVTVANINPSPSEITAGIKTINALKANLKDITAQENDVVEGKKFLASDGEIKAGTMKDVDWESTTATASDVLTGKQFVNAQGELETGEMKDVDWESTTATASDVLSGKQFVNVQGELETGELKDVDWESTTATASDVVAGKQFVNSSGDLVDGKLKDVDWESTTATTADVLIGKKFVDANGDLASGTLKKVDFSVVTATSNDVLQGKQFLNSSGAVEKGSLKDVDWESTTATEQDVLVGTKFVNAAGDLVDGTMKDVDWESTTATASDVLTGKQFVNAQGELETGSLKDVDWESTTATEQDVKSGKQFVNSEGELVEGSLKELDLSGITTTEHDVLLGKKFMSADGNLKDGLLQAADCSGVTATESDVKLGKKFLTSTGELKEGSFEDTTELFLYNPIEDFCEPEKEVNYVFSDDITVVKKGIFYGTPYKMNVWLNPATKKILADAFSAYDRIKLMNFHEAEELTYIGDRACENVYGVDTMNLQPTLRHLGSYSLQECVQKSSGIRIPKSLTTGGDFIFNTTGNTYLIESLILDPDTPMIATPVGLLSYIQYKGEIVLSNKLQMISSATFQQSQFKSIVVPEKVVMVKEMSFYNFEAAVSLSITFQRESPPIFSENVFHPDRITNVKIYVPDNSVQAYKAALPNMKIYPISEKP